MKASTGSKIAGIGIVFCGIVGFNSAFAGGDEGRLYNAVVYTQDSSTATLATDPYAFIADIRNSDQGESGTVSLPSNAGWGTNPVTVVTPSQLVGAHYLFEQDFPTLNALNAAFPSGPYSFNVVRPYTSATTSFSAQVTFSGTIPIPTAVPQVTNSTWSNGILNIQPAQAQIYYTPASGVSFSWEAVGGGGSAGGSQGPGAPGLLDLTGMLGFGQSYSMELRMYETDDATTVFDPNAPSGAYQQTSTYSTLLASIVRFQLQTPAAPLDFSIQSASFTADNQTWNVKSILQGLVNQNSLLWNMSESTLTDNQLFGQDNGTLSISYTNLNGSYSGTVPYTANSFSNYLILPNPTQAVPEMDSSASCMLGLLVLSVWFYAQRQARSRRHPNNKAEHKRLCALPF